MRLMGAANRDIAYYPFAPSVVPFGSSQFQEWPLFARCCGLCEIDVGDNQLFLVVGLADDVAVRVHHHRLAGERHIAFLADPVAHDDGHLVLHGLDTDFHRNGFDGSASVFGTDARRRHDDQAAPRNAHVRMPSRGSLK